MGIAKCENCNHLAIDYARINRHLQLLPDGKQMYSETCMEPGCRCEKARIIVIGRPVLSEERKRVAKVIASVLG